MRLIENNDFFLRVAEKGLGPRIKYLSVKYYFIKNIVRQKIMQLKWCPANDQLADTFTKALPKAGFLQKQKKIGVCPVGPKGTEDAKKEIIKKKKKIKKRRR